jgi:metallophosphoesterase superfamily enzyme
LVVLGDIVHRAAPIEQVRRVLHDFVERASAGRELVLLAGNHDRGLDAMLPTGTELRPSLEVDGWILSHGDAPGGGERTARRMIGHEHPAIRLGDGIASRKFPCFAWGRSVLVLPAFSTWAAGADLLSHREIVERHELEAAFALLGERVLRVPLPAR